MKYRLHIPDRFSMLRRLFRTFSLAVAGLLCSTDIAQSTEPTLVRIEEDWVALISEPDASTSSPQILNFISPTQSTTGVFGLMQVNHRGEPQFQSGGLQVQGWVGTSLSGSANTTTTAALNRNSDNLRYTVAMETAGDQIRFQLLNGRSRTWGRFAQTAVSVSVPSDSQGLDAYTPEFSVANTCVNLGSHRVQVLYLTAVRRAYSDGTIVTDTTDRFTHRYQLNIDDVVPEEYEASPEDYNTDITED